MGATCSGPVLDTSGDFEVLDCTVCGYAHVRPLPTPRELAELHDENYYGKKKPRYLDEVEEDREWWELLADARLEAIEAALPAGASSGSRRLCDVGSGPGSFLARARGRGWEVLGVEPSV